MVDNFSLHKALLYAYRANVNVTTVLTERLYEYFNSYSKITRFEFNDTGLYFEVTGNSTYPVSIMIGDIKNIFKSLVIELFTIPEYSLYLNYEGNYNNLRNLLQVDMNLFSIYAEKCITVLNLSTSIDSFTLRINLHN